MVPHFVANGAEIFTVSPILLPIVVEVLPEGLPSLNVPAPLPVPIRRRQRRHRCDIEKASRPMPPYFITILAGLLIAAFVP